MLSNDQINEIREHLEHAQNPLFLYDNDADGFCSFVLLRRLIGRGKGIAVRSHPDIDAGYARRVQELGADYVFVLDRPFLGDSFVSEIEKLNVPLVWIDHHEVDMHKHDYNALHYYNPLRVKNKPSNEPVTYWVFKITGRVEDLWIALMGCVSDHFLPDFSDEFSKKFPEFWAGSSVTGPFDAYYKTDIGLLARAIGFGLKDSITHVIYLQNFIISCQGPQDLLNELQSTSSFGKKYHELKKKYDELVHKAKQNAGSKVLFFKYSGSVSMSADLANELSYLYPNNLIVVAYTSPSMSNVSLRGKNVLTCVTKLLPDFDGATGGGHPDAVGARIKTDDLDVFVKRLGEIV